MVLLSNNKIIISEFYDLNGKTNFHLKIQCDKCPEQKDNIFKSNYCISCILSIIFENRFKKIQDISIGFENEIITLIQIKELLEFYKKVHNLKKTYRKIYNQKNKCNYKEFQCKNIFPAKLLKNNQFLDPIFFYEFIKRSYDISQKMIINNQNCVDCALYRQKLLLSLIKALEGLKIIKKYNIYLTNNIGGSQNFYESYFSTNFITKNSISIPREFYIDSDKNLLDKYNVLLYRVEIFQSFEEVQKIYSITHIYESKAEENFYEKIIEETIRNIDDQKFQTIVGIVDLIDVYKKKALDFIRPKYKNLAPDKIADMAFLVSLKKLNFEKIFPLLIDDFIEELFLDAPDDEIYINHQRYGRCLTGIKLSHPDLERLKTFLRIYSGKRLDYSNPSLKYVLKNKYFHCRFTVDLEPIHNNKFGFDIRKLNKNIFTIQDLLKNNTLSPRMAAFLYFCVIKKQNITVTGETDTGKTTLINALDLITPKEFRKIYIENAIESLNQQKYGMHQLKYIVEDFQDSLDSKIYSKSNQIKTLLHRSPDIIYLGEILTKEEGEAMFHCLAAGLKGFQTIHSKTIQSLFRRIVHFFNIESSCVSDMDIILLMKKGDNSRKIVSISEINDENTDFINNIKPIFNFIPKLKNWEQQMQYNDLNLLRKIRQFEDIDKSSLDQLMSLYEEIFTNISKHDRIKVERLVQLFHKISYYSSKSFEDLKKFWTATKNQLDLF